MWPPSIKLKMLIAIAILPMLLFDTKQTWAQAQANYGLGGYKMDDKKMVMVPQDAKLLNTADEVDKYQTNTHTDKKFKACRVELNEGEEGNEFEVFYDDDTASDGCTVDFVFNEIDEETKTITTNIKVADEKMACLENCGGGERVAMGKNLVPFTYSMSNEDFKNLHNGPTYKEDQTSCKGVCTNNGGKCMASATSLQLAWNKCKKVRARAWIQLVGDPASLWWAEIKDKPGENGEYPDEAVFQLSIKMGDNPKFPGNEVPLFTVKGPTGTKSFLESIYPGCFLNDALAMIPTPKFWTIKSGNTQINGKHLLVFHLLPQKATRIFDKEGKLQNNQPPEPGMPKCKGKLSIIFENVAGLLQSSPTTGPEPSDGTGPSDGTTEQQNANASTTAAPGEGDGGGLSIGIILAIVGGVLLLLIVVAVLVWFFFCRDKEEDASEEDTEAGANTEKESAKEEGAESRVQSSPIVPVPAE